MKEKTTYKVLIGPWAGVSKTFFESKWKHKTLMLARAMSVWYWVRWLFRVDKFGDKCVRFYDARKELTERIWP